MLMKKFFTLIAAALFAASVNAKEAVDLPSPWSDSFVVSGQTITITGAWQGGATYIGDADKTAYDYVWIKFTNATGKPNFGITYNEWQKKESWGDVFASSTAVVDGSGVVGIKLDKETVMVKGNAETDGVGIGDVYAQHVQQITIQSQNENASLTVEGIWFGTAAEFAADGGDVPVRPGYGESLVIWEGSTVYNGWGVSDSFDAKNFSVAKVGDIIRCTIKDVVLEDDTFNPIFKYQDWTDFAPIQSTLETDKATYFEGTIADEEALAYLKASGLRLQGLGFTLTKVELVNNVGGEEDEGGDEPSTGGEEVDIPLSVESWGWGFNSETTMEGDLLVGTLTGDWGAISTGFDPEVDWSIYEKLCVVVESYSNDWGKVFIKDKAETYMPEVSFGNVTSQTTVSLELDSEKATNIYQIAIQGKTKDDVIKVSRVYLVKRATIGDEPGTDGINVVKTQVDNGAIYNLAGQKVNENYKGLVIKNGKKYIQK